MKHCSTRKCLQDGSLGHWLSAKRKPRSIYETHKDEYISKSFIHSDLGSFDALGMHHPRKCFDGGHLLSRSKAGTR
jgi:hypothetical protein